MQTSATFAEAHLNDWQKLFQQLIRVPSTFEQEQAIAELVAAQVERLGVSVHRVMHNPELLEQLPTAQRPISRVEGRYSLAVRIPGSSRGRSLAINTHLDVVPAGDPAAWTHPPFGAEIDAITQIIYGRGAMDDKAGVTIALALLETILKLPLLLQGDVVFHFVLEDEITGNGTLLCLTAGHAADAALIIDGTRSDKAINQHAGNLQFGLAVKGKPASVSVSHMGVNAAETLARLLLRLRDSVFSLNQKRVEPWTRFPSPYQLVTQHIHSDGAQLTLPEFAQAKCYVTFPPPFSLASMRQFLADQVKAFSQEQSLPYLPELTWEGFATEPVHGGNLDLELALQMSAKRLGLATIDIGPSTGTSDLRHFVQAGIPCILYGPGAGFNPHRPDEHYHLGDLQKMILFYIDLICSWCGTSVMQPPK